MRRHPLLALLVLIPVLSLLASCGTSGGNDAADTDAKTTTTASASDDGADDPVDETTTTADDGGGEEASGVTSAQLADILPTVDDIGAGYEMSDEDLADNDDAADEPDESDDESSADEEDPMDQAIIDACPGAKILEDLDDSDDENLDEVSREFSTEADATIEVALDPTPGLFTEETVGKIVDGLADCGTIETEDEDGNAMTMDIAAEETDAYGDYGMTMSMSAEFSMMGTTIPIDFEGLVYNVDGVTVSVIATSGLDDATFEATPGDYDMIPELASLMQERVESL